MSEQRTRERPIGCDEVNELAGVYALDALEAEERDAVREHIESCELHEEFASLRATALSLVAAAPSREPPVDLRDRIMRSVGEPPVRAQQDSPAGPAPRRVQRLFAWPRAAPYSLAAVLAVVAIVLAVWNVTLQGPDDGVTVSRSAPGDSPHTRLVYLPAERLALLTVEGLDAAPEGHIYQLWVIRDGTPSGAGLFNTADGRESIVLEIELASDDLIAVTLEPAGGSALPTTDPIFLTGT